MYVRKEIVHNKHVVEQLRERGAIFVDELDDDDPGGRHDRLLRTRRVACGARRRRAAAAHDRRDLSAGDQGPPRGGQVRRRGLHDRPDRPRRPRGGRGHHGRGARHIVLVETEEDVQRSRSTTPSVAYISQTTLSVDETRTIINRCASGSPRSSGRAPTTSATRRPTARRRSSRWPRTATWCSSSARRTRRTRTASSRSRATMAPTRTSSTTRPGRGGVAGGQARRRHHLGRSAPEELVERARRVLPRPRRARRRGVRGRPGGRALHAAQDASARIRGSRLGWPRMRRGGSTGTASTSSSAS